MLRSVRRYRSSICGSAMVAILAMHANCATASCPCTCEPTEVGSEYDYVFDTEFAHTDSDGGGTGFGSGTWYWNRGNPNYGSTGGCEAYAGATAADGGPGSETSHKNAWARQVWIRRWKWNGPQSEAPGALFTAHLDGSGKVTAHADVNGSAWDASCTANGSGDSTAAGRWDGQVCEGSTNLNSVSGGLTGVSASADIDGSATFNGGVTAGESNGFTIGGGQSHSGSHVATGTRTWTFSASGEHCVGAGVTQIESRTDAQVSATADAYADAFFTLCDATGYCYAESDMNATIANLRRCDN